MTRLVMPPDLEAALETLLLRYEELPDSRLTQLIAALLLEHKRRAGDGEAGLTEPERRMTRSQAVMSIRNRMGVGLREAFHLYTVWSRQ